MTTEARETTEYASEKNGPSSPGYEWALLSGAPVHELFPGIRLRPLWQGGAAGAKAQVVEFDPGSTWENPDVHAPGPEEVYVASGTFNDGERDYPAGSFIHAPAGSWHVPQSATGCTLFVFYPEG
ncbi:cupin domain-containing protein [Streptomyces sp. ODS28]|uniref:cupin domain-containing protein n=1 Tax=Streptomyces sp. ODS28 TaxID=3136688 RepID=UPI0031EE7779